MPNHTPSSVNKLTLPNGVRIVTEAMDSVRSAAVGLWIGAGSRHEPEALGGVSHAIEHMVFKGTASRTAAEIAEQMDAIGGQVNAFTTKEATSFYARALDSHLGRAIDLLCDILFQPRFAQEDWETERGVILEEIGMYEDSPEDLVGELLHSGIYRGSSLGRPILGCAETLNAMTAQQLKAYKDDAYRSESIVVSLAGHFSQRDVDDLSARFSVLPKASRPVQETAAYQRVMVKKAKAIEQNHLCLGFPSLPTGHPDRWALQVLNGILGSGMSSRLFQQVRDQRGLCYTVYSYSSAHADCGSFGVYTALSKDTEAQALALILQIIRDFRQNGPTAAELDRCREQMKANVLMGLESTSARMNRLGQGELILGKVTSPDEIIERYDAVTREDVLRLAGQIFDEEKMSLSAVGEVDNTEYEELLK